MTALYNVAAMSRNISRFVVALVIALASIASFPGHGVRGAKSSLASGPAGVRLMHNGAIAFVYDAPGRNRPTLPNLEAISSDGTGLRRLTQHCTQSNKGADSCIVGGQVWSPDGRRIAFLTGNPGQPCFSRRGCPQAQAPDVSLFVVNANGTGERRLARCGIRGGRLDWTQVCGYSSYSRPSWSPDGTRIVFSRARSLYVVNVRTGRLRALTYCSSACFDTMPAWSPDGARIAFIRNSSLYIVNVDGSGLRRLPQLGTAADPVWSPNGRQIVFDGIDRISTINADGSHVRLLVSGPPNSGPGVPSWSPDGTHILFASTPGHPAAYTLKVWEMKADGTGRRRLYHSACCTGGPGWPIWSPNGHHIAFTAQLSSHAPVIYVMDADGRHVHRLGQFALDSAVAWQPIP